MKEKRLWIVLLAAWALTLAILVIAAWHRLPWTDEANFSSPAYNLAKHGFFGTTTLDPDATHLLRIDQRTYWVMPLHSFLLAGWLLIFPPTVFSVRLFTVLLVPLLGWLTFRLARSLTGDRLIALVSATLLPLEYVFLYTGSWARPDVLCAVFGLAALCSYMDYRERDLGRAVRWAAFFLALSGLTHPNALLHVAGLIVLAVWLDRKRLARKQLLGAATVGLLTVSPYLFYISRDFQAFVQQMTVNTLGNDRWASGFNPFVVLWRELVERYGRAYGLLSPSLAPRLKSVVLLSLGSALALFLFNRKARITQNVKQVLGLWAVYFTVQCLFNQKLSVYLIHILPLYAMLAAAAAVYISRRSRGLAVATVAWLVLVALVQTSGMLFISLRDSAVDGQRKLAVFVNQHAQNARRISGSVSLVYALRFDTRLKSDCSFGLNLKAKPDVAVIDGFCRESFDTWAQSDPDKLRAIRQRMSEYRLVYDEDGYQVYFP
ncbi:MAG: glycosyltransferase family 39 protein [Bryobacteraceae bacterium]